MKFGQLIEYNVRNIFLEKSYIKCGREKIKIERISGSIFYSILYFVLIVCQVEDYRKWLKLSCRLFAFTSYKSFLKNKKRSGTSLPVSFSAWFYKKYISIVIFYYLTRFQCLVAFTSWDIGHYAHCNSLLTKLWRQKFWN